MRPFVRFKPPYSGPMDHVPLFIDAARQELRRADSGLLIDEPGRLQITQPDAPVVWRNMIHHIVLAADETDAEIERVKAHYVAHGVPFLWRVTPACRPVDLGARLVAHGLGHFETVCCLVAEPLAFDAPRDPRMRIERVTPESAELYVATLAVAWNVPPPGRLRMRALVDRELARAEARQAFFLGYLDDEPRGVAAMSYFPGSVHFSGSAVHPDARGQGLYRSMILHRMALLRAEGHPLVTVHAVSNTSAPICKRMGFREVGRMDAWCYPPSEAPSA